MAYGWSWTWIEDADDTKSASEAINRGASTAFSFRQARRGQTSATELNSAIGTLTQNTQKLRNAWNTYTHPIINSLPAGAKDTRWPLRKEIDCFVYGVSGATLFAFNDASSSVADGRYWHTTEDRPKTIAEVFEDLYAIASVTDVELTSLTAAVDLEPLWAAVGHAYQSSALNSLSTSLDYRTDVLEGHVSQLNTDIYGLAGEGYTAYHLGSALNYSIAKHLDYLLKIHDVTAGWQAGDPDNVGHDTLTSLLLGHTHPSTEVHQTTSTSTQNRSATTDLAGDLKRIRWEINRTRGAATWQDDVLSPWMVAGYTSLGDHIGYTGNGTASANNPHGINATDTGAQAEIDDLFTVLHGITTSVDQLTYSSTNYVGLHDNVEEAISTLDNALGAAGSIIFELGTGDYSAKHRQSDCSAAGDYSTAIGRYANARFYGELAYASAQILPPLSGTVNADAQTSYILLHGATQGEGLGTTVTLSPDDLLEVVDIPDDSVWAIRCTVLGRGSSAAGVTKAYHTIFDLTVAKETGQVAELIDIAETEITDSFDNAVAVDVDVAANGNLQVTAATQAGEVAYWFAKVETLQIYVSAPPDI